MSNTYRLTQSDYELNELLKLAERVKGAEEFELTSSETDFFARRQLPSWVQQSSTNPALSKFTELAKQHLVNNRVNPKP